MASAVVTARTLDLLLVDFGHVPLQGLLVDRREGTLVAGVALHPWVAGFFRGSGGLLFPFVSLLGLHREGVVASRALVVVPPRVEDQVPLFRSAVVAEVTLVVSDLVVDRLDVLPVVTAVVGAESALGAFEPSDLEMNHFDVSVDLILRCGFVIAAGTLGVFDVQVDAPGVFRQLGEGRGEMGALLAFVGHLLGFYI